MSDWIQTTLYANGVMKNKYHIHDEEELAKKNLLFLPKMLYIFCSRNPK